MNCHFSRGFRVLIAGVIVIISSGCATTAPISGDPSDPWEPTNRSFYAFNDAVDRALLEPAANLYLKLPGGVRESVHNFLDNAAYPGTVLNQILQGKFEPAMEGTARFVFNTTLGIGGLFDVATGMGLKRQEEDFGQTLAVWGSGEGNYIHYPVLGPNSVRDTPGIVVGALTDVLTYVAALPLALLEIVDNRANLASAARIRDESAFDPYVFTREAYRQRRTFLVYDGNPPLNDFEEDDEDLEEVAAAQ
ncbi:MAG: VacJ family lipoprotein [Thiotrichales bacterium]|nr:VacJ family lipoprotein [Thiotrichales bacterium]